MKRYVFFAARVAAHGVCGFSATKKNVVCDDVPNVNDSVKFRSEYPFVQNISLRHRFLVHWRNHDQSQNWSHLHRVKETIPICFCQNSFIFFYVGAKKVRKKQLWLAEKRPGHVSCLQSKNLVNWTVRNVSSLRIENERDQHARKSSTTVAIMSSKNIHVLAHIVDSSCAGIHNTQAANSQQLPDIPI